MESINPAMKAQILTDALPYIQKYYGKTVVVKYGGNAMINPELKCAVMSDIILLSLVGIKVVLAVTPTAVATRHEYWVCGDNTA